MYNFTVPMALMDFVPVFFFGVTAVLLLRDLYNKMFKGAYALLAAGSVNVFLAGFCKALWKLLYAANICDFVALEEMFMPVNSLGLLFVAHDSVTTSTEKYNLGCFSESKIFQLVGFELLSYLFLGIPKIYFDFTFGTF